jgi:hypothetical protein
LTFVAGDILSSSDSDEGAILAIQVLLLLLLLMMMMMMITMKMMIPVAAFSDALSGIAHVGVEHQISAFLHW